LACDFDNEDDSDFGEHRQKLSDDKEICAMQDDSESKDFHPISSADVGTTDEGSGDKSSKPEAKALPHFGTFRSPLLGRGHGFQMRPDSSSDREDSFDCLGPHSMEISDPD